MKVGSDDYSACTEFTPHKCPFCGTNMTVEKFTDNADKESFSIPVVNELDIIEYYWVDCEYYKHWMCKCCGYKEVESYYIEEHGLGIVYIQGDLSYEKVKE